MTADALPRTSPLHGWAERFAALPAGIELAEEPFVSMVDVRGPDRPAAASAIRLGPDEWLVTGATEADLRGPGVTAVEVSAQRTTLRLRGAHARDVLETGCAIDLHPREFPAGSATQTTVGGVGVILVAEADGYRLIVRASFAAHLAAWLEDAATEFR